MVAGSARGNPEKEQFPASIDLSAVVAKLGSVPESPWFPWRSNLTKIDILMKSSVGMVPEIRGQLYSCMYFVFLRE